MAWYGEVWYGVVWCGMVWYGMAWHGMVWYGMVWYATLEGPTSHTTEKVLSWFISTKCSFNDFIRCTDHLGNETVRRLVHCRDPGSRGWHLKNDVNGNSKRISLKIVGVVFFGFYGGG